MQLRRRPVVLLALALAVGCSSGEDKTPATSRATPPVDSSAARSQTPRWFDGAAPLVLVPGHATDRALIALADTSTLDARDALRDSIATLFRFDATSSTSRISTSDDGAGCQEAIIERAPSSPWGVGFIGGSPTPLVVDTLHGMSRRDSTDLTRTAFRLASAIPPAPGRRFFGLAFGLVDLWRIHLPDTSADHPTVLVASLKRQINEEDNPLEERTFIIAEASAATAGSYQLVYHERDSGAEETIQTRDLLAAVRFPSSPADIVVARDFGGQQSYSIIERVAPGKWIQRWTSRRFSC
jgi:hypothetical protein